MGERGCSVKDISQLGDMKIAHASFVAFMAVCSNCAAFPNGQYVKRYKKSKIDDIVQLCNSLGEHTKKKKKTVQMSTLVRNFAKQMFYQNQRFHI